MSFYLQPKRYNNWNKSLCVNVSQIPSFLNQFGNVFNVKWNYEIEFLGKWTAIGKFCIFPNFDDSGVV